MLMFGGQFQFNAYLSFEHFILKMVHRETEFRKLKNGLFK